MVSIHDSVARIYEQTGHAGLGGAWSGRAGRLTAAECVKRKALCEFRAGRYRTALAAALTGSDLESHYWRARAAAELALAAFKRLDGLPDSRERREMRATRARAERRLHRRASPSSRRRWRSRPATPRCSTILGTAYYRRARLRAGASRRWRRSSRPTPTTRGCWWSTATRCWSCSVLDEALPVLQRAVEREPSDPTPRLALGRAHLQKGDFAGGHSRCIEPQLAGDNDGSLHVQLARAYTGRGTEGQGRGAAHAVAGNPASGAGTRGRGRRSARTSLPPQRTDGGELPKNPTPNVSV